MKWNRIIYHNIISSNNPKLLKCDNKNLYMFTAPQITYIKKNFYIHTSLPKEFHSISPTTLIKRSPDNRDVNIFSDDYRI